MNHFPWTEVIGFGLGIMRLSSHDFWRMTPRELAAAIRAVRGHDAFPPSRNALDALMQRFPDKQP